MQDETIKNKSAAISAIMNNQKLSKAISDGLNSPINSSKRQKAASILNIFNGNNNNQSNLATLYGPTGTEPKVVQIGSQEASDLQSKGWGLTKDSYSAPADNQNVTESNVLFASPKPKFINNYPLQKSVYPQQITQEEATTSNPNNITPSADTFLSNNNVNNINNNNVNSNSINNNFDINATLNPSLNTNTSIEDWYNGLSKEDKYLYKPFYESAIAGFSPKTAAWKLMEDTDRLRKLGVPDYMLPMKGASLAGQLSNLADTLKEETGLIAAQNNLKNLQERGMTINDDLNAYIIGKDQYIKKINDLLDKAQKYENKIDMSLPENQKSMKSYKDYLYILKGRQQKRYIDFLKSGINYYNQKLRMAKDTYNTALQNFRQELTNKTAITKENYNRLDNILMDMYKNIIDRNKIEINKQITKNNLIKSNLNVMKDIINYQKSNNSGWNALSEKTKARVKSKYLANSKKPIKEAEADFSKLSDAEKLRWLSVGTNNKKNNNEDDINFYVNQILLDAKTAAEAEKNGDISSIKNNQSLYYDPVTNKPRWYKIPANIRTEVQKRLEEMIKNAPQKEVTAKNTSKKSNPRLWFDYFFGKK